MIFDFSRGRRGQTAITTVAQTARIACSEINWSGAVHCARNPKVADVLTVFAVQKVTHRTPARGVGLAVVLETSGGRGTLLFVVGLATGGAAIGETRLVGFQLELLATKAAGTDWEGHGGFYCKTAKAVR
jgi:hypothetical protein